MKRTGLALVLLALLFAAAAGLGETRYVDNRDRDKATPQRLNLRTQPNATSEPIGSYYSGTEVTLADEEIIEGYVKVEVGGKTGYMSEEFLITADDAASRYGDVSAFAKGRAAEVDLTGMWITTEPLQAAPSPGAQKISDLQSGESVQVFGFVGNWLYVAVETPEGRLFGYVRLSVLTEGGEAKAAIAMGSDDVGSVSLRSQPQAKAEEVLKVRNGAVCLVLFGRSGNEWYRVRVGGVTGWIRNEPSEDLVFLKGAPRSSVPYYPPLMQVAKDSLLCRDAGSTAGPYMTLGEGMKVEVLGTAGEYAYVRTLEGGVGAYESGDFGYILAADLGPTDAAGSVGVAQADDGDLPVLLYNTPGSDGRVIGALEAGAQVRILNYTQTEYVQLSLGGMTAYAKKRGIRLMTDAGDSPSDRIPQRAVVREEAALCREPANDAEETGTAEAGSRVYMLAKVGEWAFVNVAAKPDLTIGGDRADKTGFVRLDRLNAPAGTTHLTAAVRTDKVNIRQSADRNSPIIGKARLGELLRVADYGSNWTCVVKEDGTRGYIMTEYLTFD